MITPLLVHAALAACAAPVALADLEGRLDHLDAALVAADSAAARAAVDAVRSEIPCLGRIPGPPLAARLHRAEAIGRFLTGDPPDPAGPVGLALRAARRLDPTFVFEDTVLPAGHRLRALYEAVDPPLAAEPVAKGPVGWWFDGARSARPPGLPTLAQRVDRHGEITTSVLLDAGAPLPEVARERPSVTGPAVGWAAGTLAAGVGAGVILHARSAWDRSAGTVVDRDAHAWWATEVRPAQTMGVALIGLGAAAVGLSTVWAIPLADGATVGVTARW